MSNPMSSEGKRDAACGDPNCSYRFEVERRTLEAEAEVERLRKIIRAEHAIKAAAGGSPCICEVCRG